MLLDSPLYSFVPVKDLARAQHFYERTLGFKGEPWPGGVLYRLGGGTAFFMYEGARGGAEAANAGAEVAPLACWFVADIAQEVAALASRGIDVEDSRFPVGLKTVSFRDMDGNVLVLVQDPRPQDARRRAPARRPAKAARAPRRKRSAR